MKLNIPNIKIKLQEFDSRLMRIFSSKLGQRAKDFDSFVSRVCREIKTNSPEGLKFAQLRSFEREGQNCSFKFELGYGWEEDVFPLF